MGRGEGKRRGEEERPREGKRGEERGREERGFC